MLSLHRCTVCGTRWLLWPDAMHGGGWNLLDKYQRPGSCCDNVAMGKQIEHLRDFDLRAGADDRAPARPSKQAACGATAPDRSGRTCDKPTGHVGDHWSYGLETMAWAAALDAAPSKEKVERVERFLDHLIAETDSDLVRHVTPEMVGAIVTEFLDFEAGVSR